MKKFRMFQKVGDRGTSVYSVKDWAFTLPANAMSDRGQMVIEYDSLRRGDGGTEEGDGKTNASEQGVQAANEGPLPLRNPSCVVGAGESGEVLHLNQMFMQGKFTVFSTFSGVGGYDMGVKAAIPHATIIGMSEIDKHANAVLKYRYPDVPNYGDIKLIDWDKLKEEHNEIDLLTASPPCQPCSVAGKRGGFSDHRWDAITEGFYKAVKSRMFRMILIEEVQGFLTIEKGEIFVKFLEEICSHGYEVAFSLLNAKDFNVAQNRSRTLVFCRRLDDPSTHVNPTLPPMTKSKMKLIDRTRYAVAQNPNIKWFTAPWPTPIPLTACLADILEQKVDSKYYLSDEMTAKLLAGIKTRDKEVDETAAGTITANYWKGPDARSAAANRPIVADGKVTTAVGLRPLTPPGSMQGDRVYDDAGVSPTIPTAGGGRHEPMIVDDPSRGNPPVERSTAPTLRSEAHGNNPAIVEAGHGCFSGFNSEINAPSLRSATAQNTFVDDKVRIRRLTPRECERLMDWPSDWTRYGDYGDGKVKELSQTSRYKACGNGIVAAMVCECVKKLIVPEIEK